MDKINDMHFGSNSFTFQKAIELRMRMTEAETVLWEALRNKKFHGLKFRRQHPIERFIVDFYCHQYKLVIELDGYIHELLEVKENDLNREEELKSLNLKILRFKNEEVLHNLPIVLEQILQSITELGENPSHQNHPLGARQSFDGVDFSCFPNPAKNYFTLEYKTASKTYKELWVEIRDAQGKLVMKQQLKVGDNSELIGLKDFSNGNFFVNLIGDNILIKSSNITIIK